MRSLIDNSCQLNKIWLYNGDENYNKKFLYLFSLHLDVKKHYVKLLIYIIDYSPKLRKRYFIVAQIFFFKYF